MTAQTSVVLNPVAVSAASILRAIAAGGAHNRASLARLAGRLPSNIARDLALLAGAGLISADDIPTLTDEGRAQLEAITRAESARGEPGSPPDVPADHVVVVHAQLIPDPDNARKDWDSAEAIADLADLAESIAESGLLQNPMVRRAPQELQPDNGTPAYILDGGERRWRAIGRLIVDSRWPADRPILCRLIETDDLGHRLAALAENLQRRNLNPLEKARAFDGLAEALAAQGVAADKINRDIADRIGVTIEHVQQHRNFLNLDEADQQRLTLPKDDPKRLSVSDARKRLAAKADKESAWKPTDQSPEEQLLLAELAFMARRKSTYLGNSFAVAAGSRSDPVALRLAEQNIITLPEELGQYGEEAGHYRAGFNGWTLSDAIRSAWPDIAADDVDTRAVALRALQMTLAGRAPDGDDTFLTPWLNGPFELTDAGKAIVEERRAADEARERAERERAQARAANLARWAEARARHLAILDAAAETAAAGAAEDNRAIAADLDRPLPWRLTAETIVAANGETVRRIGQHYGQPSEHDLALAQMMVVAVNAAGGQTTPPLVVDAAHAPLDEAAFVREIADSLKDQLADLSDDDARSQAEAILHEFLTDNTIAFGDDGFGWTAEDAQALADSWTAEQADAASDETSDAETAEAA